MKHWQRNSLQEDTKPEHVHLPSNTYPSHRTPVRAPEKITQTKVKEGLSDLELTQNLHITAQGISPALAQPLW